MFLRLGVTSFGGPVAHLGYFREAFVERRRWLTERAYADLVALCQFLPGPASSQVGMAIGLQRAGMLGLLAAWAGFTLPSAILLVGFAYGAASLGDAIGSGWLVGLKAAAVAVVAHAVLGMAKTLTPDARRATIAVGALTLVLLIPGVLAQVAAIIAAAIAGWAWLRPSIAPAQGADAFSARVPRTVAIGSLIVFALLLAILPILATVTGNGAVGLVDVSIGLGLSCSAAGMSSCRCWKRRRCRPASSDTMHSSPDTVPRRPYQGHCSPSRRIWARSRPRARLGSPGPRSRSWRSSSPRRC